MTMLQWLTAEHAQLISKPLLQSLLPLAERRGIAPAKLCKGTGIAVQQQRSSTHKISAQDALLLSQRANQLIGDPQLWHLVAETMLSERLSPLVDVLLHAPTMAQTLGYFVRHQELLQPLQFSRSSRHQAFVQLHFLQRWGDSPSGLSLALLIAVGQQRGLAVEQWRIGLPPEITPLPIWQKWGLQSFASPLPVLQLPVQQLRVKLQQRQPERFQQALWFCQLQDTTTPPSFLEAVFAWLQQRLHDGHMVTLEALASAMALSTSSCKRQFHKHGTSFQQQLDLVRLYQLLHLLQQHPYNNHELATRLGYSNSNNFRRACKRWLGIAPDLVRAQLS